MRNKKSIIIGALIAPALALSGGLAYASTTGGPATPTRPTVTSTVVPKSQNQDGNYRCDWRPGNHRCDWRGHGNQQHATQHPATQHRGHRNHNGYQGSGSRGGYGYGGQGNWGSGQYGNGSRWGNGSGCCRHGW